MSTAPAPEPCGFRTAARTDDDRPAPVGAPRDGDPLGMRAELGWVER
jgi:hypothetical protein